MLLKQRRRAVSDSTKKVPPVDSKVELDDESTEQASEYKALDYAQLSRESQFERDEEWLDELARIRKRAIRVVFYGGGFVLLIFLVFASGTALIHLFVPQIAWLTDEQQAKLVSAYSSLAQVLFPVLIVTNPWLIRLLPRRELKRD